MNILTIDKWGACNNLVKLSDHYAVVLVLQKNISELEQQLEAARKDAERLDFIEQNARVDPRMDRQHVYWPTAFNKALRGPNLRAAIDAAIEASKAGVA